MKNGPSTDSSKEKTGKKIAWISGGIFLVFLAILSVIPSILSTRWGKEKLEKAIGQVLHSSLVIDQLSLSWFGSQKITGITVQDEKGQIFFASPSFSVSNPLWKAVFQGDLGDCHLESPVYIARSSLPLTSSLKPHPHSLLKSGFALEFAAISSWTRYWGRLTVTQGKIEVLAPQVDPITFDEIFLMAERPLHDGHVEISVKCNTMQQQLRGSLAFKATVTHLEKEVPELVAQASAARLPVRGIDQIASQFYPPLNGLLLDLIGPTIDMDIDVNAGKDTFQLNLDANSPQFTAHLSTHGFDGIVSLKTPGLIKLTMPPKSFAKFSQLLPTLRGIVLTQPATFLLNVTELSMNMPKQLDDFKSLKMEANFAVDPGAGWEFQGQTFSLQGAQAQLSSAKLSESVAVQIGVNAKVGDQTIQLSGQAQLSEVFGQALKGKGGVRAERLPLAFAQHLLDSPFPLVQVLGPSLDISFDFNLEDAARTAEIAAHTANLDIPSLRFSLGREVVLLEPTELTYRLNPQVFPEGPWHIAQQVTLQSVLQEGVFPLGRPLEQMKFSLQIRADLLPFVGFPLANLKVDLKADTFDQLSLYADSDRAKLSLIAALNLDQKTVSFNKPLQGEVVVNNALYQAWVSHHAALLNNAVLSLILEPFSLSLDPSQFPNFKMKGVASTPLFTLASQDQTQTIALASVQVPFQLDAKNKVVGFQFSSQVGTKDLLSGNLNLSAILTNLIFSPSFDLSLAQIEAKGNLTNIPTVLLDAVTLIPHATALLGPTIDCAFKGESSPDLQSVSIQASTPLLNFKAALVADGKALQLQGGQSQASWKLTPESYLLIDRFFSGQRTGNLPFTLQEASPFSLTCSSLYIPLRSPPPATRSLSDRIPMIASDLSPFQIAVQGKSSSLSFIDAASQENIQLNNSTFSLSKEGSQSPVQFIVSSGVTSQIGSSTKSEIGKSGSLNVSSTIDRMLNDQGEFDLATLSGKLSLTLSQFPSKVLDIAARIQGKAQSPFSTLFGDIINAEAAADLNALTGPIALSFNSPHTRFSLEGKLDKGTLLLEQPLHAQALVTAEMSRLFLRELNPLSISYIYSQGPVTLEVSPAGFQLPLHPYDPARINVPQARIELGRIHCLNEGNINTALALLKSKQFSKDKELMLWFTPIDLHVDQGQIDIERTEILVADTFDIAIWGKFNMVNDYVDMLLGLPSPTLQKAFGIKGLPENYVLTIPMKGPADKVQIDTGKATAKVALLLAWQQSTLAGAAAGGPAGALVGGLLGKLATLPDKDVKVPPAKHPFPWESGKSASRKSSSFTEGKKKHFKGKEKPLKQILKVIR